MWFFLTAYDPADLPGGSIDPLGFERGYLFLADKILPGMTNVANCPRYFGVICSAIQIADVSDEMSPREQRLRRQEAILRLERLWALSNVLAADEQRLSGLRGVTYAQRQAEWLSQKGHEQSPVDFKLLSRQVRYGAIGIYGAVAENVKLLYRKTFDLTPGLGAKLAEAFMGATNIPSSVRRAALDGGDVSLNSLRSWGQRAYLWGDPSAEESECIREIIHGDSVRSRFAQLLEMVPFNDDSDTEMERLGRVASLARDMGEPGLAESAEGIRHYEGCYRLVMVGMERLLFLCHTHGGAASPEVLKSDEILTDIRIRLAEAISQFIAYLSSAKTEHFLTDLDTRLQDTLSFLKGIADVGENNLKMVEAIVSRHTEVQHGKFDQGRRKAPWVNWEKGSLALTMTRISETNKEITTPEGIEPHPYRLYAADAWIKAAKKK